MHDDSQGPESVPDIDIPESSADTPNEAPETHDNDEVVLAKEEGDVWQGLEKNTKEGAEFAKKIGAETFARQMVKDQLIRKAMDVEASMHEEGSEPWKLNCVWNELTPEGRTAFLNGNSLLWKLLAMVKTNLLPMVDIAENCWHFFKRKTYKPENLDIGDFKPEIVQMYCSLGLLECSEEEAKAIDTMAAKGLKVGAKAAKVLGWIALAIPGLEEVEPALKTLEKGAALAAKPAEWGAELMPEVRSEVKRQSVEVQKTRMEEHNKAGEDLEGDVNLPPVGPMDEAKAE